MMSTGKREYVAVQYRYGRGQYPASRRRGVGGILNTIRSATATATKLRRQYRGVWRGWHIKKRK